MTLIVHSAPKTEGLFDRLETIGGLLDTKRKTLESLDKDVLRQAKIEDIEQEVEESSVITEKLLEAKRKVNQALKGRVIRRQESPNTEEIRHQQGRKSWRGDRGDISPHFLDRGDTYIIIPPTFCKVHDN